MKNTKRKIRWDRVINAIIWVIIIFLFAWFIISYIDINLHNGIYGNPDDCLDWNLFVKIFKLMGVEK